MHFESNIRESRFFIDRCNVNPHTWADILACFISDIMLNGVPVEFEFVDWNNHLGVEHLVMDLLGASNITHSNNKFIVPNDSPRAYLVLIITMVALFDWGIRIYCKNTDIHIYDDILTLQYFGTPTFARKVDGVHSKLSQVLSLL